MVRVDKRGIIVVGIIVLMISLLHAKYTIREGMGEYVIAREIALAGIFAAIHFFKKKMNNISLSIYGAFIVYRLLSSWRMKGAITGEARAIIYVELGVLVAIYMMMTVDNAEIVMKTLREIGSVNAVLCCLEFLLKNNIFINYITVASRVYMKRSLGTSNWRVRSFLVHPIICAVFITATWIVLLYIPYRKKWLNYVIQICMLLGLIGTKSRSSWIAFLAVNILYFMIKRIKNRGFFTNRNKIYRGVFIIIGLLCVCVCFGETVLNLINSVINRWIKAFNWNDAGNYNRVEMIKMGLSRWKTAPMSIKLFGNGPNYAIELLARHAIRGWTSAVDNTYLTTLLNYGIVGLGLFMAILFISIYHLLSTKNNMVEMASLGIISIFISAFFYDIFSWFSVMILFCVLILRQCSNDDECSLEI